MKGFILSRRTSAPYHKFQSKIDSSYRRTNQIAVLLPNAFLTRDDEVFQTFFWSKTEPLRNQVFKEERLLGRESRRKFRISVNEETNLE